jgi:MFS family permease
MAAARPAQTLSRTSFGILFSVSIVVAIGNTGMQSVLPAIGRKLHIADWMVAGVFSLSAILWAVMSPIWAQESDARGRKPLILLGLIGFIISMLLCGLVVSLGIFTSIAPPLIFVLFLVARATFGLIGSASNPATQAYVAEHTSREQRTEHMAGLASAFGLGTIVGPVLAPLFVLPVISLAGPMFGFSLIAAVMLAVVWRLLPESHAFSGGRDARPFARAARREREGVAGFLRNMGMLLRDPRLVHFLIFGFLVACCQTAQLQILGFMIIDKLHITPEKAQPYTATAMMAGAMAGLLAQLALIRLFRMTPATLMKWGVGLAAIANLLTAFAPNFHTVVVGYALGSLGYGFARPGFTAGASLTMHSTEQAKAAGAIAMVNGLNVVLGPAFVLLYGFSHPAPFLLNAVVLSGLLVYAFLNGVLRRAGENMPTDDEAPDTPEEQATLALLERSDEG